MIKSLLLPKIPEKKINKNQHNVTNNKLPLPTQQLSDLHEFFRSILTIAQILMQIIYELQVSSFFEITTNLNNVLEHIQSKKDPFSKLFAFS